MLTVATPRAHAAPARGPVRTAVSRSKALTAPNCVAITIPTIRPAPKASGMSMPGTYHSKLRDHKLRPASAAIIVEMDEIDSVILTLLREDARLSWRDLGAKVGLSANAAADRVRRLRRAGIITGFTAQIDPAAGGRQIEALISVVLLPGTDSDTFATLSSTLGPVSEVLHLAGTPDYQLRVACHDTAALDLLLRTLRLKLAVADTDP